MAGMMAARISLIARVPANTANRYGDSTEETATLEQEERIRRLVGQGVSERFAREEVLVSTHESTDTSGREVGWT